MGGGTVFSCEAKSGNDQILVEGSSLSAAESSSKRREECIKSVSLRIDWSLHVAMKASAVREDEIKDGQSHVFLSLDLSLVIMR